MVPTDDEKPPEGGDVVSIEEARKKAEEKAAQEGEQPAPGPGASFLEPVMQAIGRELAQLAGPDGKINLNLSGDELARAKTAALLKGLGEGLGAALAQAFSKWADKIELKVDMQQPPTDPSATPPDSPAPPAAPGGDDDQNKPS